MIDLKNTYIKNDKGELRELYLKLASKQGYKYDNAEDYVFKHLMCSDEAYVQDIEGNMHVNREITLADLKPRTKTEYVKVEFSYCWEIVKEFELSESDFYTNVSSETYGKLSDARDILKYINRLYRKVETKITWQDEVKEYLLNCTQINDEESLIHNAYRPSNSIGNLEADNKWDEEFIQMCHLVASMTDNKKVTK